MSLEHTIAGFNEQLTYKTASEVLSPLLSAASNEKSLEEESPSGRIGVTALMIACDRGQVEVVRFLVDQSLQDDRMGHQIGRLWDVSPEGNTCVHLAALSSSTAILQQLVRLTNEEKPYTELSLRTNSHGDTPIMMACVSSSIEFLTDWFQRIILKECNDSTEWRLIVQRLLQSRNNSNDSAFTLASGHGRIDVLNILMSGPTGTNGWPHALVRDDLSVSEVSLSRLEGVLKMAPTVNQEELSARFERTSKCAELIREALAEQAEAVAAQLFQENSTTAPMIMGTKRRSGRKKKKSQKGTRSPATKKHEEPKGDTLPSSERDLVLTQLSSGTKAVIVKGSSEQQYAPTSSTEVASPSPQELLRDRFTHRNPEINSVMEALCLDVSMLLQTSHGMALLSPSQLDAVEQILSKQQYAVREARAIQARLHAPPINEEE